jgi:hypothetical protein
MTELGSRSRSCRPKVQYCHRATEGKFDDHNASEANRKGIVVSFTDKLTHRYH